MFLIQLQKSVYITVLYSIRNYGKKMLLDIPQEEMCVTTKLPYGSTTGNGPVSQDSTLLPSDIEICNKINIFFSRIKGYKKDSS